jgi:hypothetical protein
VKATILNDYHQNRAVGEGLIYLGGSHFFLRGGGGVQNDQIDFSVAQEFGKTGPANRGVFINPTWTLFGSS